MGTLRPSSTLGSAAAAVSVSPTDPKPKQKPASPMAPPTAVPRVNIGFLGSMNVGKSTLMNLITQSNTSIVDAKAGTTADIKMATMEMHKLGPVKLFDTAGLDEEGSLGDKKREKTMSAAKESDLLILVIDPKKGPSAYDREVLHMAHKRQKKVLVILNEFDPSFSASTMERTTYMDFPALRLRLIEPSHMQTVVDFIETEYQRGNAPPVPLLPLRYMGHDKTVMLVIPMDAETPGGRLLRPQARVQEFCIAHYTSTVAFRMDLAAGRSKNPDESEKEKKRFQDLVERVRPGLIITDSQAMDIVHPWLDQKRFPDVDLTTFSIVMINDMTGGNLKTFVEGLKAFQQMQAGQKILIAEACNHNRLMTEVCADISTCQIPRKIDNLYGASSMKVDHAFGREFPQEELKQYNMVIHCGGCMVDKQKIMARVDDCVEASVPITNYGLLLSWFSSPAAVERVVKPMT
eukprot:CAMPEP_0184649840 /NCGR_PEP_ID=MMETSP0308-20130426/7257_1 /TAXON_ID=38269 /ORGANISM="Gloeochaete witrockiana, Strain SAG 46.84" /LENGTH=461 /DNA_ID=CAMNT_0027082875 /DNA_START=163 /DNA_END=1548 /DNA_ORIENTATION=+